MNKIRNEYFCNILSFTLAINKYLNDSCFNKYGLSPLISQSLISPNAFITFWSTLKNLPEMKSQITLMQNSSRLEDTCINYSIISFFIVIKIGLHTVFCLPLLEVRYLHFSPPVLLDSFV